MACKINKWRKKINKINNKKRASTHSMCEYEKINPTGINTSLQVNILTVVLKINSPPSRGSDRAKF